LRGAPAGNTACRREAKYCYKDTADGCIAALILLSPREDVVAKGQQRSNREKKKPKQDKKKVVVPATQIGSTDQRGKAGQSGGSKKNS
jgi:hypothetical protein